MTNPLRSGSMLSRTAAIAWGRVRRAGVCAVRGSDRDMALQATPCGVTDSSATAGRDRHVAGAPGHPTRWARSRRAAIKRTARDRARRPLRRRGRPARRAPPRTHRRDHRPHCAAQALREAESRNARARAARSASPRPLRVSFHGSSASKDRRFNAQMSAAAHTMLALFAEGAGIGMSLGRWAGAIEPPLTWACRRA